MRESGESKNYIKDPEKDSKATGIYNGSIPSRMSVQMVDSQFPFHP